MAGKELIIEQSLKNRGLQAAASQSTNGAAIIDNRTTSLVQRKQLGAFAGKNTVHQKKGKDAVENGKGVIQAKWTDENGDEHKGNPPKGWVMMNNNVIGVHWVPGDNEELEDDEDDFPESSSVEEKDDDSEYVEKKPSKKSKKKDDESNIKKGTYNKTDDKLEYETGSGIKHEETYDSKLKKRIVESKNLSFNSEYRNPAHRDNNMFKVYNPYDLSVGQQGQNQMVVSHSTPSWSGMQAGKEFGNFSFTSPKYNSEIEKKEKKFREKVQNSKSKFSYKTETEYEEILSEDASEIEKEINKYNDESNWDKNRIKKRLRKVKEKYPESERVKSEKRTMNFNGNKSTFSQGRDLMAYIPKRAYSKKAAKKYKNTRGKDSEGSDEELEYIPPKKKKK